jgi:hypothetical protein
MQQGLGDLCSRNEMRSRYRWNATADLHAPAPVGLQSIASVLCSRYWMTVLAHLFTTVRRCSVGFKWFVAALPAPGRSCGATVIAPEQNTFSGTDGRTLCVGQTRPSFPQRCCSLARASARPVEVFQGGFPVGMSPRARWMKPLSSSAPTSADALFFMG